MTEQETNGQDATVDYDRDRYPSLRKVLHAIGNSLGDDYTQIDRVDVYCFASGEASYRVWAPKAEEPQIGHIPAQDL